MSAASIAAMTGQLRMVCIEQYGTFCKAVYSDGRKLIIGNDDAVRLAREHTVPIVDVDYIAGIADVEEALS